MLKKIVLGLAVILVIAVANDGRSYVDVDYKTENYILKLKLEIYELKSKNSQLEQLIKKMQLNELDLKGKRLKREKAIAKLRRELKSRKDM